jgi:hypothetical protein
MEQHSPLHLTPNIFLEIVTVPKLTKTKIPKLLTETMVHRSLSKMKWSFAAMQQKASKEISQIF